MLRVADAAGNRKQEISKKLQVTSYKIPLLQEYLAGN